MQHQKRSTSTNMTLLSDYVLRVQGLISLSEMGTMQDDVSVSVLPMDALVASVRRDVHIDSTEGNLWTWEWTCMQASKGAVRQAGKEVSKVDKQKARETAQMEKQASREGKKRARDDSKPAKASGRSDPAAKKYALCACSISHHNDVRSAFNKDTMRVAA